MLYEEVSGETANIFFKKDQVGYLWGMKSHEEDGGLNALVVSSIVLAF